MPCLKLNVRLFNILEQFKLWLGVNLVAHRREPKFARQTTAVQTRMPGTLGEGSLCTSIWILGLGFHDYNALMVVSGWESSGCPMCDGKEFASDDRYSSRPTIFTTANSSLQKASFRLVYKKQAAEWYTKSKLLITCDTKSKLPIDIQCPTPTLLSRPGTMTSAILLKTQAIVNHDSFYKSQRIPIVNRSATSGGTHAHLSMKRGAIAERLCPSPRNQAPKNRLHPGRARSLAVTQPCKSPCILFLWGQPGE